MGNKTPSATPNTNHSQIISNGSSSETTISPPSDSSSTEQCHPQTPVEHLPKFNIDRYEHEFLLFHTLKFLTLKNLAQIATVCTLFANVARDPDRYLVPLGYPHSEEYALKDRDRVEAVDRKYPQYCCVCTIYRVDKYSGTFTVTFDGWTSTYDYDAKRSDLWKDIFPIGYTPKDKLNAPKNYVNLHSGTKEFSWEVYLDEKNTRSAPPLAWFMYTGKFDEKCTAEFASKLRVLSV